jgi:hypothetical protein
MSAIASRNRAARRGAFGAAIALAGVVTAGTGAAFLALLVSKQGCSVPEGSPSAQAKHQIPAVMLTAYEQAGGEYGLPWEILAGIGKEECDHGLTPDPSCTVEPGAQGAGTANYAGASGPMQIGVGGAAGDEYQGLRHYLPPAQHALGPHDPMVATELAALVLIKDKGAPTGKPIDSYWRYVRAYNGSGPAASAYADRVIADAHQYQGGDTLAAAEVGCAAAQGSYVNPFSQTKGLVPGRIDMGVDYTGHGAIVALGDAKITYAASDDRGWAYCGAAGALTLQLLDGPDQGRDIYMAEGLTPTVAGGRTVTAGQTVATFAGQDCIEIGWSATASGIEPEAAALGQQAHGAGEDPGANRTFCGNSMSELLASLGASPGLAEGKPVIGDHC